MKKQNKRTTLSKKKIIIAAAVPIILVAGFFVVLKARYYNDTANQANMVQIRELILLAVRGLKKNAPVEPRTGDVYFPESKLYLPSPDFALPLTYIHDTGDVTDSQGELSISTYPVRNTEKMYMAKDMNDLFTTVPKLQACSRGIKLTYNKFPQEDTTNVLRNTVRLNNGRDLYIYLERDCPELGTLADTLKNIQAY